MHLMYSSIEHLIINNSINLKELDSLLSYVPQLRRLSIHSLYIFRTDWIKVGPLVLNHLTHLFLTLGCMTFNQFEKMVIDHFPTVQVLSISHYSSDQACMDAKIWEQLVLFHMPNLCIFDIKHDHWSSDTGANINNEYQLILDAQINQFTSSFWSERSFFLHNSITRIGEEMTMVES